MLEVWGYNYAFADIKATNIALNKATKQSSTKFDGVSSRAVDGITNGHYAEGSVTHTAGHKTHVVKPGSPIHEVDPEPCGRLILGLCSRLVESSCGTEFRKTM